MQTLEKEYVVHLDEKNRFAIRGAKTRHYRVEVFKDGHILLSPQKLVDDPPISSTILKQIKRSVSNMKRGRVSAPIDIKAARKALKS
jgi:hypothetical protein